MGNGIGLTGGQAAQIGATYQCTRCEDPENPNYLRFKYELPGRLRTARAALRLSQRTPENVLSSMRPTATSRVTHNSARFMSLGYYAGGLPMVRDCTADEAGGNAPGWYVFLDGQSRYAGSKVWDNHNRSSQWDGLMGFVAGKEPTATLPPDDAVIYPHEEGAAAPIESRVETTEVFASGSVDPSRLAAAIPKLQGFRAGDYLFINSRPGHGLMIIGYGPAVPPGDLAKIDVDPGRTDARGLQIGRGSASAYVSDPVPYVVDWNIANDADTRAWLSQHPDLEPDVLEGQRPRPFYFTRILINPYTLQFDHTYWLFVQTVSSMKVHCAWFYAVNAAGDPNAPFLVDDTDPAILVPNRPITVGSHAVVP
jgi:hypothetical protein